MKNVTIKVLLFSLLLTVSFGLKAQSDNTGYEYAIIHGETIYARYTITTSNGAEEIKVPKGALANVEMLKKIEEMSKEGWVLINENVTQGSAGLVNLHIFYLRKKITK